MRGSRWMRAWVLGAAVAMLGLALVAWALAADAHWAERHVLASYCATDRAAWVAARALPWIAGALGLAAAVIAAPAVARLTARTSIHFQGGTLAGVAVAVVASLAVTELYMRHSYARSVLAGRSSSTAAPHDPMARRDPRLGWSYSPGRTTWIRMGDRVVPYAIDVDGDRAPSSDHVADPDAPTVLFAGESIAFGYGLPYEETIPFLVGRALNLQAVNLAVVGYGNDQAYLRLRDELPRYRRAVAVVTVFVPDQVRRNVDIRRPRLALDPRGGLALVPPSSGLRITKLLQTLPYHDDGALRVTAAVLRATAELARARGAAPLFLVTNYGRPCVRDDDGEAWVIDELFARQGLPFIRVDLQPEDQLPGAFEWHPNLRGTQKLAAGVERALSEELPHASIEAAKR